MFDISELKFEPSAKSDRDTKIIQFFVEQLQELNEYRQNYSAEWKIADDRVWVRSRRPKGRDAGGGSFGHVDLFNDADDDRDTSSDWRSHIFFPHEFSVMRQAFANMIRNLPDAVFETFDEKNQWKLEVWKKVWEHVLNEADAMTEMLYALIDMRIKGVGFLEIGYLEKYKSIREAVYGKDKDGSFVFSPANIESYTDKKILEYDGLLVQRRDPNDVWIDSNCVDLHSLTHGAKIAITKDVYDIFTFRREFEGFKNVNRVVPVARDASVIEFMSEQNKTESEEEASNIANQNKYVHVYKMTLPDTDERFWIANNEVLYDGSIEFAHKRINLAMLKNVPVPGNLYVPGEVSFMQYIAESMNVFLGLAMDNKKFALQPHTFIEESDELDPEDILTRPMGYTPVPRGFDVNKNLQVWTPPDVSGNVTELHSMIEDKFIQVTGTDTRAMFPPSSEKVTQTMMKKEISNNLLDLTIKYNEINGLKDAFELMTATIMEFYPRKKVRNYLDPSGEFIEEISFPKISVRGMKIKTEYNENNSKQIDKIEFEKNEENTGIVSFFEARPEFIRQQLIIKVKEGSLTGTIQELMLKRWIELIQLLTQFASVNPEIAQKLNWDKIMALTFKKYNENPDDVLIRPEVEETKSELEKELMALKFGKEYTPKGKIDSAKHADSLMKEILKGGKSPREMQALMAAQMKHLEAELSGEQEGVEEPPIPMMQQQQAMQQGAQPMQPISIPNKDQELSPESMARSAGARISKGLQL